MKNRRGHWKRIRMKESQRADAPDFSQDEPHIPVLLEEVLTHLRCLPDNIYIDCTIGQGGHAFPLLERSAPTGFLIGLDRDLEALEVARKILAPFHERIRLFHSDFQNLKETVSLVLTGPLEGWKIDGILFDLGFSTLQVTRADRGFSFSHDGPLDMRMDQSRKTTAEILVNRLSPEELNDILWKFGEERWHREITEALVKARTLSPITRTHQLANIVTSALPFIALHRSPLHPATKTFQALRIAVNRELEGLDEALEGAIDLLSPGGRICVISFHSLEDRIVKQTFKRLERGCICPPKTPRCVCGKVKRVTVLTAKPIRPSAREISFNRRARSGRLRVAERVL